MIKQWQPIRTLQKVPFLFFTPSHPSRKRHHPPRPPPRAQFPHPSVPGPHSPEPIIPTTLNPTTTRNARLPERSPGIQIPHLAHAPTRIKPDRFVSHICSTGPHVPNDECAPPPSHDPTTTASPSCKEATKISPTAFGPLTPLPATPTRSRFGDARFSPIEKKRWTAGPTAIRCTSGISGDLANQAPKRETDLDVQWSDSFNQRHPSRRPPPVPLRTKARQKLPARWAKIMSKEQK